MKSVFNANDNKEFIERIKRLTPQSKAEWGKMNVSQMVKHAQMPLKVAAGELKLKRGLIGILFGGFAKKQLIGPKPFGKNLPTDKNFIVGDQPDFEKERATLIQLVERFSRKGINGITKEPHPFFGKLTSEEWDILQSKHLDHHLRQFRA